jgi:hypothetical protein
MGKFKMKGVNFGEGTGNVTEVQLNSGPKPYYGGTPDQPGYINPDNPMFDKIKNPDKVTNYVNMPEGTGPGANLHSQYEENVHKRDHEGSSVTKGVSGNIAKRISEDDKAHHEQYEGVKDGGAGYSDMMLGAQNTQEEMWEEQYGDLENRLYQYMGDPSDPNVSPAFWPGEGTDRLTLDKTAMDNDPDSETYGQNLYDLQFEKWSNKHGNEQRWNESDYDYKKRMETDVETVMNLDSDLKMAAEVGYHLDPNVMEDYILDDVEAYQPTQKSEALKVAHIENEKLRKESLHTRKSDKALAEFNDLISEGYTAGEAAQKIGAWKIDHILGLNNASNPYQAETESVIENSKIFRDALASDQVDYDKNRNWRKGKVINPSSKEWDEERWGPNPHDSSVWNADAGMSNDDFLEQQQLKEDEARWAEEDQEIAEYDAETEAIDAEPEIMDTEPEVTEQQFDPMDTNQDGYVDKWEKKDWEKLNKEKTDKPKDHIETEEKIEEEFSDPVEDIPPPPPEEPPVADFSGANPYEYGTDEFYQWKKDKRSHKLGLTKRIFNVWGKQ